MNETETETMDALTSLREVEARGDFWSAMPRSGWPFPATDAARADLALLRTAVTELARAGHGDARHRCDALALLDGRDAPGASPYNPFWRLAWFGLPQT